MSLPSVVIMIPCRMGSQRLAHKPLKLIHQRPMISHVIERALESGIAPVYVAVDGEEIAGVVEQYKGKAILTDPSLPSGTDRIAAALKKIPHNFDFIINLQGDLPLFDPSILKKVLDVLLNTESEMATLVAPIGDSSIIENRNSVKVALSPFGTYYRALYFSRAPLSGYNGFYQHIGIYGYRAAALKRFVNLPISPLENLEKLEQLRALEDNMRIVADIVKEAPISVDTLEDLEKANEAFAVRDVAR